jgi:hypothetical protein
LNTIASSTNWFLFISVKRSIKTGVTPVQIAYSHVNEYFNRVESISTPIVFEIIVRLIISLKLQNTCKRILLNLISKEYNHAPPCNIIAFPPKEIKLIDYNKYVAYHYRMYECYLRRLMLSSNLPTCPWKHKDNEFGDSESSNQLGLFFKKRHFDKVNNADGMLLYWESNTTT